MFSAAPLAISSTVNAVHAMSKTRIIVTRSLVANRVSMAFSPLIFLIFGAIK